MGSRKQIIEIEIKYKDTYSSRIRIIAMTTLVANLLGNTYVDAISVRNKKVTRK